MRRAVLLLCLVTACGDDGPTGPITARVTHYDYKFDIESRAAHATLTLAVDQGGDCVTIPLRAMTAASIANVTLDGEAANGAVEGDSLTACGPSVKTGGTAMLDADLVIPLATLADSQVGYSRTQDAQGNVFYYLVSWVGGCDRFGPCDNRADQFATYHFTVTHPATFKVRCPGTIKESGTETECTFEHDGGPTYSTFGVAAYNAWTIADKGTWGGLQVSAYDRASTGITTAIDSAYHAGFVDFMQSNFGAFPYGNELRILTAPTYWSGFEHPGNIVLSDTLASSQSGSSYANPTAHVLDHEIAHMWAGDQTTLARTHDFVWKEAMAEYLSFVWEDMNSATVGARTAAAWKSFSRAAAFYPVPQEMPQLFDYYGDVYGPGPMVLFRQLEVMTSRAQVLAAIKMVLGQAHAITVEDVVAALETSTALDLDAYVQGWIVGTGAPDWPKITLAYAAGTLTVTTTNKKANPRGCKFHVALRGANMETQLVEVDTFTNGADQTISVTAPAFTVTSTLLDPLSECLVFPATAARGTRVNPWVVTR